MGCNRKESFTTNGSGEPNEQVFSGLAGLPFIPDDLLGTVGRFTENDIRSGALNEAVMDQFYSPGFAKIDYKYNDQEETDSGVSFMRVGKLTTKNGPKEMFAGDYVAWQFPDPVRFMNGNRLVLTNPQGTPYTKILAELVRFDPSDFSTNLAYFAWNILNLRARPNDLSRKTFDTSSEAHVAILYGLLGIVRVYRRMAAAFPGGEAAYFEALMAEPEADDARREVGLERQRFARANIGMAENGAYQRRGIRPIDRNAAMWADVDAEPLKLLMGGNARAVHKRTSRVIGKSCTTTAPNKDMDLMVGHFVRPI